MRGEGTILRGDAMAAGIFALRLKASDATAKVYAPLDDLLQAEGEIFPVTDSGTYLDAIVTAEWPAYLERTRGELNRVEQAIALFDPVQTYEVLREEGVQPIGAAPDDAETIDLPRLDAFVRPSQILQASADIPLDLPILRDASDADRKGHYTQFLPMGSGMVMVRTRQARRPLLCVQNELMGLDEA